MEERKVPRIMERQSGILVMRNYRRIHKITDTSEKNIYLKKETYIRMIGI